MQVTKRTTVCHPARMINWKNTYLPPGKIYPRISISYPKEYISRTDAFSSVPTGQKSSAVVRRNTFFHPSQSRVSWRMSTTISVLESSVAGATTDDHWISWCEALIFIVRVGYPTVLLLITHLGDRYCARLSSVSEGIQLSFWLSVQRAKDLNIN